MTKNFRQGYYSSLGVKAVEIQPSLTNAFQHETLKLSQLKKLCLWVRIPHLYRPLVWKVILGTLPLIKSTWPFVSSQQTQEFELIVKALGFMIRSEKMSPTLLVQCVLLTLLPNTFPQILLTKIKQSPSDRLLHLAKAFLEISASDLEAFLLFRSFIDKFQVPLDTEKSSLTVRKELESMRELLQHHDPSILERLDACQIHLGPCGAYVLEIRYISNQFQMV